jgi:hypothetical protein
MFTKEEKRIILSLLNYEKIEKKIRLSHVYMIKCISEKNEPYEKEEKALKEQIKTIETIIEKIIKAE